jgi:luciferase family oxidoreductase group 1
MIPFSVLDLSPIAQGATPADALHRSLDLARHAERLGYRRFWVAEHHNMPGIASAATPVVIGYIAAGTKTIRVGSGGIMLPNHAPLIIAEQFGTLAALYPDRIDLGLGRAPGTDPWTAQALRRDPATADRFPQDVRELQGYFEPAHSGQRITAVPGAGTRVPLWILGSSLFGANLAAEYGLPFVFASHFAPGDLLEALALYRERFQPSAQLKESYAVVAANVFAADTEREARRHFSSLQQAFINLRRGKPGLLPPPVDDITAVAEPHELAMASHALAISAVGSPTIVEEQLRAIIEETQPDELIVAGHFYDHAARVRSLGITAQVRDRINRGAAALVTAAA